MEHSDFQEIVDYLYSLLPIYQNSGNRAIKKDLKNIQDLCWSLGRPQWKFRSIHVGGTNGKGSVSAMLSSILQEAGYKTGLYSSPHLQSFTERIRINGVPVSENEVVEWVKAQKLLIEMVQPSFFELTVAMAFSYFAEELVDIAVLEVGLGGRLDSTNIVAPELSLITNVDFDHQEILGNTRELIATEKAGIIKPYTPIVIGETHPETTAIFLKVAAEKGAPIYFADQYFVSQFVKMEGKRQLVEVTSLPDHEAFEELYELDLLGQFQLNNLQTTLQAVSILKQDGWDITDEHIQRGLATVKKNTGLMGRMEVIQNAPFIICDTAHNEAGIQAMLISLEEMGKIPDYIIWGMVAEKDHERMLALLPKQAQFHFVAPNISRALSANALMLKASAVGLKGQVHSTVQEGIKSLLNILQKEDCLLIGGSTYVVAEALSAFRTSAFPI